MFPNQSNHIRTTSNQTNQLWSYWNDDDNGGGDGEDGDDNVDPGHMKRSSFVFELIRKQQVTGLDKNWGTDPWYAVPVHCSGTGICYSYLVKVSACSVTCYRYLVQVPAAAALSRISIRSRKKGNNEAGAQRLNRSQASICGVSACLTAYTFRHQPSFPDQRPNLLTPAVVTMKMQIGSWWWHKWSNVRRQKDSTNLLMFLRNSAVHRSKAE